MYKIIFLKKTKFGWIDLHLLCIKQSRIKISQVFNIDIRKLKI